MAMTPIEVRVAALDRAIKVLGDGADPGRVVVVAGKFEAFLRGGSK